MDNFEVIIEHESTLIPWLENISQIFEANSLAHKPLAQQSWPLETSTTPNSGSMTTHIHFNTRRQCEQLSQFLKSQNVEHELCCAKTLPWQEYHQKHMKEITVGSLVIKPQCAPAQLESKTLYFPAGLGFGTGHHETTRGCLELMQKVSLQGQSILDFGSGSGILSVAAGLLGAKDITYLDIDEQALEATRSNLKAHHLSSKSQASKADKVPTNVDCILANILYEPLIDNLNLFSQSLKPGKILITSGVLDEQAELFETKCSAYFKKVDQIFENNWCSYLWEKL